MNTTLRRDAEDIVRSAIEAVKPDKAVRRALEGFCPKGRVFLVAVGKAAWQMARAAVNVLPMPIYGGIVLTKYHHAVGEISGVECYEAGHPVPDENSFRGTEAVLELTQNLLPTDTVLFLLSGGGSALFEKPLIPAEELQDITRQLLACGADIVEINTLRKRMSGVKGGRFALHCAPAKIEAVILSDILGDPLDMIASGPTAADPSTVEQAQAIIRKYALRISQTAMACLSVETPKNLDNVHTQVIGSVRELCQAAAKRCCELGYEPIMLTDRLDCEAREAGRFLGSILASHAGARRKTAFLAGGETVVHLTGAGIGGRNQELALAAAPCLEGLPGTAVVSVGSDGTDGPTDAAGGYVDGFTLAALNEMGLEVSEILANNNAYPALKAVNGLIQTGPTGTNVNDISVALLDGLLACGAENRKNHNYKGFAEKDNAYRVHN